MPGEGGRATIDEMVEDLESLRYEILHRYWSFFERRDIADGDDGTRQIAELLRGFEDDQFALRAANTLDALVARIYVRRNLEALNDVGGATDEQFRRLMHGGDQS